MPYQREAIIVLEMWRDVERQLGKAAPGSVEARQLELEAARLRDEYQRLVKEALRHSRPVPPPFPEEPSARGEEPSADQALAKGDDAATIDR
jgi:hypothetical protein